MSRYRVAKNHGQTAASEVGAVTRSLIGLTAAAAFALAVLFVTRELIAPSFSYQGYTSRDWDTWEIVRAAAATAVFGLVASVRSNRTASFAVGFLVATVAIPLLWIPVFYGILDGAGVLQLHLATFFGFGILWFFATLPGRPLRMLIVSEQNYLWFIVAAVLAIFAVLVLFYGIRPAVFTFGEVYDQRDEYNESIGKVGRYLIGALTNALLPVLVVFGAGRKRVGVLAFGVLGFLLAYSMTGFKSVIVGLTLTVVAIIIIKRWPHSPSAWLVVLFGVVSFGYLIDRAMGTITFSSILTRRAITTSGINSSYFIDFFADAERYMLRHSFLSFLGESPYHLTPARLIGSVYYQSDTMAANANILADGYANFGFAGALGACAVAGFCLWMYGKLTGHLPTVVSMPALVLLLVAWANTAVFTSLVTHGGFLLAILVALMPWPEVRSLSSNTDGARGEICFAKADD